jgi:F0F1-type ATP synthase membrane subunit c/vacuolar-type H+-ATPase subunit K
MPEFNLATTLKIDDKEATDSDILSLTTTPETLERSKVAYDTTIYGVAIDYPTMVYRTRDTLPVVRSGTTYVNVTTVNGPIKTGDYITSSDIPGKGQKSTEFNGYVVGVALDDFNEKMGKEMEYKKKKITYGKVLVAVGIGPASPIKITAAGGMFGTFKFLITSFILNLQTSKEGVRLVRYFLAALVAITSIAVSFRAFGKNVAKGIESIGRNPLAKVQIQSMIVLNIALIAVVTIGGIVLSLVIISL